MKITHVLGTVDPAFGGPVSVVYGLAEAQMRLGHQVMVVSLDSPFGREGRPTPSDSSVQTALYPVALPSLGLSRGLLRHLSSAESDCVIHFHSPYHFGTALGITRALRAGAPTLFHPHGAFNIYPRSKKRFKKAPYERLIERRRLEQADAVICASLREAAEVRLFCGGAKTAVVPLGVSTPHVTLRPQDIVRRQPTVLFLGRVHPRKGVDLLVRAMAVVCEQHNSATLKIVGPVEDRFRRYLRRIAEESGVANAVHFAGAAFGEERDKLMTAADIFVLPSHDESFGLAPLEALMCGLPVVVSEKVDSVRALPRSAAARIVDRTPAELGAAILTTLRSDTAHEIARLQRHIAENLTWDASAAKMEHLYSELRATGSR